MATKELVNATLALLKDGRLRSFLDEHDPKAVAQLQHAVAPYVAITHTETLPEIILHLVAQLDGDELAAVLDGLSAFMVKTDWARERKLLEKELYLFFELVDAVEDEDALDRVFLEYIERVRGEVVSVAALWRLRKVCTKEEKEKGI